MTAITTRREELQAELNQLVTWRENVVSEAQAIIDAANRRFDAEAIRLNRELRKCEPAPEPIQAAKRLSRNAAVGPTLELGFTQEEIDHYWKLKGK